MCRRVGEVATRIALLGVLVFAMRSVGAANYGLLVIPLSALVVVLTSFARAHPEATIVERGIDTAIGGAVALVAYAVWPTWERTQTPGILADLLDAYRRYVAAVMAGYLTPGSRDAAELDATRLAARLARTNAEASIARLRAEPAGSTDTLDRAVGLLTNSHRLAHSVIALEASLYHEPLPAATGALHVFAAAIDSMLCARIGILRDPSHHLGDLPDLRAAHFALSESYLPESDDGDSAHQKGAAASSITARATSLAIVAETDRIADSINTMTALL